MLFRLIKKTGKNLLAVDTSRPALEFYFLLSHFHRIDTVTHVSFSSPSLILLPFSEHKRLTGLLLISLPLLWPSFVSQSVTLRTSHLSVTSTSGKMWGCHLTSRVGGVLSCDWVLFTHSRLYFLGLKWYPVFTSSGSFQSKQRRRKCCDSNLLIEKRVQKSKKLVADNSCLILSWITSYRESFFPKDSFVREFEAQKTCVRPSVVIVDWPYTQTLHFLSLTHHFKLKLSPIFSSLHWKNFQKVKKFCTFTWKKERGVRAWRFQCFRSPFNLYDQIFIDRNPNLINFWSSKYCLRVAKFCYSTWSVHSKLKPGETWIPNIGRGS